MCEINLACFVRSNVFCFFDHINQNWNLMCMYSKQSIPILQIHEELKDPTINLQWSVHYDYLTSLACLCNFCHNPFFVLYQMNTSEHRIVFMRRKRNVYVFNPYWKNKFSQSYMKIWKLGLWCNLIKQYDITK